MKPTLAATPLPPSAVHTLVEIDLHGPMTVMQLGQLLGLEKSSVSRMVKKLVACGELAQTASREDARIKWLTLTARGRKTVQAIHGFARNQVKQALATLPSAEQERVVDGLSRYGQALQENRNGQTMPPKRLPIRIQPGYRPGIIGSITEMHARHYSNAVGFGRYFEAKVAADLAEFTGRLGSKKNGLWVAYRCSQPVGAIAIDGEDMGPDTAHLRWFILDERGRGHGVGKRLLKTAVDFCKSAGFSSITLWTFRGLDAARHLYEQAGFELMEEVKAAQWGKAVWEQRFVLKLPKKGHS
ncbi:MAG: MarR family transcriptional regulator [Rhodocyclaceae bacterium]|nr:MAG: MarR family transcriptional regulator [Rhodocyclaceae bacterium]